jgi:hypothetical protein
MGRRNPDRYTDEDWRLAGETVEAIIANGWVVYTQCDVCDLRIVADLPRIRREMGGRFVLWGRTAACRRMGCPGRAHFWCRPHGAIADVAMTAGPRR